MRSKHSNRFQTVHKAKSRTKRDRILSAIMVIIMLTGLGLLIYPSLSNWVNSRSSSRAAASYIESVSVMDQTEIEQKLEEARAYNRNLTSPVSSNGEAMKDYDDLLSGSTSGIMGTLSIPSIQVDLPIYHGTDEDALMNGIGHLEGTSLPVGGTDTHTVLTGHRGMPSATLLTRLDEIEEGDIFVIRTLGKVLTYQIDQIHTVLPEDMHYLQIEKGEDLATLVTCTPYGVNTHRLLVRGHRVDSSMDFYEAIPDARLIRPSSVAIWIGIPLVGGSLIYLYFFAGKGKKEEEEDDEDLEA